MASRPVGSTTRRPPRPCGPPDRQTKALVLSDDVRNAKRYGKLVEDLGVTQAPAIVIVDRGGKARLIEGFVDAESLVQDVADAR